MPDIDRTQYVRQRVVDSCNRQRIPVEPDEAILEAVAALLRPPATGEVAA